MEECAACDSGDPGLWASDGNQESPHSNCVIVNFFMYVPVVYTTCSEYKFCTLHTGHCRMYNVHRQTVFVKCTRTRIYYRLHNLYNVQCTNCPLHNTMYNVQCTLYTVENLDLFAKCALCIHGHWTVYKLYNLYNVQCTVSLHNVYEVSVY